MKPYWPAKLFLIEFTDGAARVPGIVSGVLNARAQRLQLCSSSSSWPSLHLIVGGAAVAFGRVLLSEIHCILRFLRCWRLELVAADKCSGLLFINICTLRFIRTLILGWIW